MVIEGHNPETQTTWFWRETQRFVWQRLPVGQ